MPDAFYLPTDAPDRFVATRLTEGPWGAGLQHGGPPSALVTRAIERVTPSVPGPVQVTRLTVEILGAVPIGELTTRASVIRPGRSVELVEAELLAGDRPVLRALAWRVRRTEIELPTGALPLPEAPPPRPAEPSVVLDPAWRDGYLNAFDWRFLEGHLRTPGPATVWARQEVALLAGEEPSPLQRFMAVADSGNGLSRLLDAEKWWFINTELTVHLHTQPSGEWVGVQARTTLNAYGSGLAETVLYDETGRVGRGAQALLVGPRD